MQLPRAGQGVSAPPLSASKRRPLRQSTPGGRGCPIRAPFNEHCQATTSTTRGPLFEIPEHLSSIYTEEEGARRTPSSTKRSAPGYWLVTELDRGWCWAWSLLSPLGLCSVRRGGQSPSEQPPRKESSRRHCSAGLHLGSTYGLARRAPGDQNCSIWLGSLLLLARLYRKTLALGKDRRDMSPSKWDLNGKARGSHSPCLEYNTPLGVLNTGGC